MTIQVQWNRSERFLKIIKAHANGRNIVGQQNATFLGPTCFICLHGTTTMLTLVGTCCVQFETGQAFGPSKRTQHCWPKTPNNTQQCCDLLRPFTWALSVYTNKAISSDRLYLPQIATVAFSLRTWDSNTRIGIINISSTTEGKKNCNFPFENQLFGYIH